MEYGRSSSSNLINPGNEKGDLEETHRENMASILLSYFGFGTAFGIILASCLYLLFKHGLYSHFWLMFTLYLIINTLWDVSELLVTGMSNPEEVCNSGKHSFPLPDWKMRYGCRILALAEFTLMQRFWPTTSFLYRFIFCTIALVGLASAQYVYFLALREMGSMYSRETTTQKDHVLVLSGVFRFCRHPIYAATWWWIVCSQLLLLNPGSGLLIPHFYWTEFGKRIEIEESNLIRKFSRAYEQYRMKTPVLIPLL